jgi:hypothetical protein
MSYVFQRSSALMITPSGGIGLSSIGDVSTRVPMAIFPFLSYLAGARWVEFVPVCPLP